MDGSNEFCPGSSFSSEDFVDVTYRHAFFLEERGFSAKTSQIYWLFDFKLIKSNSYTDFSIESIHSIARNILHTPFTIFCTIF